MMKAITIGADNAAWELSTSITKLPDSLNIPFIEKTL